MNVDVMHRLRWFLDRFHWLNLCAIGKHGAVRSSYFWLIAVPLLARLLAKFESEYTIQILGSSFTLTLDLPFSWKMFYFSSVAIAAATTVYAAYCPPIIKELKDFADFEREGKGQVVLKMPIAEHTKKYESDRELVAFVVQFCEGPGDAQQITRETLINEYDIKPSSIADAFHYVRGVVSRWHPLARVACASLYAVGFALLLWVFVDTFVFVVQFTTTRT